MEQESLQHNTSAGPQRKRRFVVDIRETSYHVTYIDAVDEHDAKRMLETNQYEASHVNIGAWEFFRVAEIDEDENEIAVIHDDFDRSWDQVDDA